MRLIKLTQGKVAKVDEEDYEFLMQWKWHFKNGYAARTVTTERGERALFMHRVLCSGEHSHVDHKDGDGLNNCRENLRPCNHQQNQWNRKAISRSSDYKGVCWCKRSGKWRVYIMIDKRQKFLGYFEDEKQAARSYDEAAEQYFGEFARTNNV